MATSKEKGLIRSITVAQKAQTQINFAKHKSVSKNTNQFPKTQINFPKHKSIFQNTNQFPETQINFTNHLSVSEPKDWALPSYERGKQSDEVGPRVFRIQYGDYLNGLYSHCFNQVLT